MPTIAEVLGATPHLSPLLRRTKRLGFASPVSLLRLAVSRGCTHYAFDDDGTTTADPGREVLSDEELAISMLSGAQSCDPVLIRCAVQLLSGERVVPERVLGLARKERCLPVLRHVAQAALPVDQNNPLWSRILTVEDRVATIKPGRLPHPSRFMLLAGRNRQGLQQAPLWLKPRPVTARPLSSP